MICHSATASNGIDQHASNWTDLGLEVTFFHGGGPVQVSLCATTSFTTNAGATTAVRIILNGQPTNPPFEGRIRFGTGEKGPITLAGCLEPGAGQHTIKAQFLTEGNGNSCFSGTRYLTVLA